MPVAKAAAGGRQFPCRQCGALLLYAPGSRELECDYCGHRTPIDGRTGEIVEYDFREALGKLATAPPAGQRPSTQCTNCAAEFDFEAHQHAGECPFCGTQIVLTTGTHRHIAPESLLPFRIDEDQASGFYRRWVAGLWFAPSALRKYARRAGKLTGVYIPYWTYDSRTETRYRGQRGDVYMVPESYTVMENGRPVRRTRMVSKVRWTPVSGRVARFFDDVLVGATRSLPRKITDRLMPWDLENLELYDEKYLSGFRSEVYQVDLDEGFEQALRVMEGVIRNDIARDIGGDHQRITWHDTRHSQTTFKHLLLPVWSSAFQYRGKSYRFVVNGRTGKVRGERPFSALKIALTVIAAVIAAGALIFVAHETGMLEELVRNY